jgi:DNA-binding NarL/FixJ family response regulator
VASTAAFHLNDGPHVAVAGKVLVVDDDDDLRTMLCELLVSEGYDICQAGNGREALAVAARVGSDVVLLDVHLPGLHGYEVCRRLRIAHGYRMAIVFLSGSRTEAFDRIAGLEAGGDDYMTKPFDPGELLARVAAQMRRLRSTGTEVGGAAPSPLTPRQEEVVLLLSRGADVPLIASELFISPATVRKHIERVHRVLGVRNRAELVSWAHSSGFLEQLPLRGRAGGTRDGSNGRS